jgi:sec-independent protein translocase protein TatA
VATLPAQVVSAIVITNSHAQLRLQSGSESDMGSLSIWHWLLFLAVALLMFGGSGKISSIMGDVAKGIKSFKKGMAEDDEPAKKDEPPKVLEGAGGKPGEQQPAVEPNKAGWSAKT